MKKKITIKELKSLIKEEASKLQRRTLLENEKKGLQEELEDMGAENYYLAVASKDTPEEETRANIIQDTDEDFEEYEEYGWNVQGPMSEEEASIRYEKLMDANGLNRYLDTFSDREVERAEQNWMRDGDDGMSKPAHISAVDNYHEKNKESDSRIADVQKRKFRDSKDW
jgi:hypothetical protein